MDLSLLENEIDEKLIWYKIVRSLQQVTTVTSSVFKVNNYTWISDLLHDSDLRSDTFIFYQAGGRSGVMREFKPIIKSSNSFPEIILTKDMFTPL